MSNTYKSKVVGLVVAAAKELVGRRIDLVKENAKIAEELKNPDISHLSFLALSSQASKTSKEIERLHLQEDVWNRVLEICTEVEE